MSRINERVRTHPEDGSVYLSEHSVWPVMLRAEQLRAALCDLGHGGPKVIDLLTTYELHVLQDIKHVLHVLGIPDLKS